MLLRFEQLWSIFHQSKAQFVQCKRCNSHNLFMKSNLSCFFLLIDSFCFLSFVFCFCHKGYRSDKLHWLINLLIDYFDLNLSGPCWLPSAAPVVEACIDSLLPFETVNPVQCVDCYERHGMLILLPSDVQGRGSALIISSRVPLKEKPSGGGWRAVGWGV